MRFEVLSENPGVPVRLWQAGKVVSSLQADRTELEAILHDWRSLRKADNFSDPFLAQVGGRLAKVLMPQESRPEIERLWKEILNQGGVLDLAVTCDDPALGDLPWELLWIPSNGSVANLHGFLALQPPVRFSRRPLAARARVSELSPELRILVVVADPETPRFPKLSWLDAEIRGIRAAFREHSAGESTVRIVYDAVPAVLESSLRGFRPHIVHFAGHAQRRASGGVLVMQGAAYQTEALLPARDFAKWLANAEVALVVLAACDSSGVAESLHRDGIPAVIGMQTLLRDACQPQFSRAFYGALADGADVADATAEARQALGGLPGAWNNPVLFLSGDAQIFVRGRVNRPTKTSPHNIPAGDLRIVGRESETAALVRALLIENRRLVTITGPGGIGKTRFAAHVAKATTAHFPDGTWIVRCDDVSGPEELASAIAGVLDIPAGPVIVERLLDHLKNQASLLVLDCFERLASSRCNDLVQLVLESAPGVSVLVTSRCKLGIPAELTFGLRALDTFGVDSASAELFFASSLLDPRRITSEDRKRVEEICEHLEGVPLAIVLAAARTRHLDLKDLLELLHRNTLRVLESQGFGLAIQRSLSLVPEGDQHLLWSLGIFSGSFTWHDVVAVFDEDPFDLLDGLERLTTQSLLQVVSDSTKRRFRLLDTIREYMSAVVVDNAIAVSRVAARRRHADRFCKEAERIASLMAAGQWKEASEVLWPNLGNFRTALDFCREYRDASGVSSLSRSLCRTLMEAGLWDDFELFAAAAHDLQDRVLSAELHGLEGAIAARQGDALRCKDLWLRRVLLCEETGDLLGATDALMDLAAQAYEASDYLACERLLDRSEPLTVEAKMHGPAAEIQAMRALNHLKQGKLADALRCTAKAVELAGEAVNPDSLLFVGLAQARVFVASNDARGAVSAYLDTIARARAGSRVSHAGIALLELAPLLERDGQVDLAARCNAGAVSIFKELRSRRLEGAQEQRTSFISRHQDHAAGTSFAGYSDVPWQTLCDQVFQSLSRSH